MKFKDIVRYCMGNTLYERSREYEFVMKYFMPLLAIPKKLRKNIRILDVGGAESRLSKFLAEQGFDVYVIDIREDDYGSARFIKANILEYDFPEGFFDIIVAISTVEHVGLPCYGQELIDRDGDVKALRKLKSWLRSGGLLLLTLPFGVPHHPPDFERVYNLETLRSRVLFVGWDVVECRFYCFNPLNRDDFVECSVPQALVTDAVVCLALRRV